MLLPRRQERTELARPLRQRMILFNQRGQTCVCHVGIDLGGRDIGVAQHNLHRAQVRPTLNQMGCKSVTQNVRAHFFGIKACRHA